MPCMSKDDDPEIYIEAFELMALKMGLGSLTMGTSIRGLSGR